MDCTKRLLFLILVEATASLGLILVGWREDLFFFVELREGPELEREK